MMNLNFSKVKKVCTDIVKLTAIIGTGAMCVGLIASYGQDMSQENNGKRLENDKKETNKINV